MGTEADRPVDEEVHDHPKLPILKRLFLIDPVRIEKYTFLPSRRLYCGKELFTFLRRKKCTMTEPGSVTTFFKKSFLNLLQYCFCFIFWFFGHEAYGILAPQLGIESKPPVLEGTVLTHWTTRAVPVMTFC